MVFPLKKEHALEISKIHVVSLSDDFLPSLGVNFLETFYKGIIGKSGVYGFVDIGSGRIRGFIVGTKNMKIFFKQALKANFLKLFVYLFIKLLKKPSLIKKILETFFYPKKETGPKAELIVVAVSKKWQSQGIGRELIKNLEEKFLQNKINNYKLTVHADKKAVYFYEKLGYQRLSSFNLYDKMWYVYAKKIS